MDVEVGVYEKEIENTDVVYVKKIHCHKPIQANFHATNFNYIYAH